MLQYVTTSLYTVYANVFQGHVVWKSPGEGLLTSPVWLGGLKGRPSMQRGEDYVRGRKGQDKAGHR